MNYNLKKTIHNFFVFSFRLTMISDKMWIEPNNNEEKITYEVAEPSPRMKQILEGINIPGVANNSFEPPDWLDMDLFNQGRKFMEKNLFSVFISDLMGILSLLSVDRVMRPLLFTGKSDTKVKALKRYVSTILHVLTWFRGNVWDKDDPSHLDVKRIRNLHKSLGNSMNTTNKKEIDNISSIKCGYIPPECPFHKVMNYDLRSRKNASLDLDMNAQNSLYISQWDMAFTQYAFTGIIVTHPKQVGGWNIIDDDLRAYIHFWRGIGWLLGIEDRFNFCNGSLEDVKSLCYEVENTILIPQLASSSWDYEHMSSCAIDGIAMMVPGFSFPSMQRYIFFLLDIDAQNIDKSFILTQKIEFYFLRFLFEFVFRVPFMRSFFKSYMLFMLDLVTGKKSPWWWPKSWSPSVFVEPSFYKKQF